MKRSIRAVFRFSHRINSILSVFKYNDERIKLLLNLSGFHSNRVYIYPDFHKNRKYYYKDFHRYYSFLINDKNQYLFTQLTSYLVFSKLTRYSDVLGVISKNVFISYQKDNIDIESIITNKKFVVKPILGGKGDNVYICKDVGNGTYLVNSEIYLKTDFIDFIKSLNDYIVQEFIEQHNYLKDIYSDSTNTIRLVTMREPISNEIFIAWSAQRIGTKQSTPVDNWTAGGISAEIDVEKGILSAAKYYDNQERKLLTFERHPDSNAQIKGITIPHWDKIKTELMLAHRALPNIHFIAWDIVVTQNAFEVIEVNNTSGVEHIQVHRPLLKDQRIKDFFQHHGIVK